MVVSVRIRRIGAVAALACAMLHGTPAARNAGAQESGASLAEMDRLFQQILRKPSDLDANLRFAQVAIALKDYEAAIGAFERLLFYNPDNGDVQLQLGRLYLELQSTQMARNYFAAAAQAPAASASVRQQANAFLAKIDGVATKPWWVYASFGARYQSNANAGPNQQIIRAFGQAQVAPQTTTKQADWNIFALTSAYYGWSFDDRGDTLEFNVAGYYALQNKLSRLDLGLIDLQVGPRFMLPNQTIANLSVRPYAIATYTALGGSTYFSGPGAGVTVRHDLGSFSTLEHFGEYRRKSYENSFDYPLATEQTGNLWSYALQATGTVTGNLKYVGRFTLNHNVAARAFNSFDQVAFDVGLPFEFTGPVTLGPGPWIVTPTVGFSDTRYGGPDPSVDPFDTRHDTEWRAGVRFDIPIFASVGFMTLISYSVVDSNIINYDTRNLSVSFGSTLRF
jgi:tetratricopeptide (TPR) repeat protein